MTNSFIMQKEMVFITPPTKLSLSYKTRHQKELISTVTQSSILYVSLG